MPVHDLHAHSNRSDGALDPQDLVARAKEHGVDVLALTDHDTTAGIEAALAAAACHNIAFVSGIEISVTWEKYLVHIVGLCVDWKHPKLTAGIATLQGIREQRAEAMAAKLERHGVPDAMAGAKKFAPNGCVTRRHFAHHIVDVGLAPTLGKVFERFLRPGKPGYVATQWATLGDAVDWINAAGGVAVIAHPQRYDMSKTTLRRLAQNFVDCGGAGIEVVFGGCGQDAMQSSAALANRFGLHASAGSDFHDPGAAWAELGRLAPLPPDTKPIWTHERFRAARIAQGE